MQLLVLSQNREQDTIRVMDMQGLVRDMCVCESCCFFFLLFDFWEKVSWVDGKNRRCFTLVPCQQPTNINLGGCAMLCERGKTELCRGLLPTIAGVCDCVTEQLVVAVIA